MKNLIILLTSIFLLISCSDKEKYTIDGAVYAGGNFEGEMVYLVPFFRSTSDSRIDSATIQNSRFHFEGEVSGSEVYEIRFRPMMELFLDKLVVIKEPGSVWVILNRPSTAQGTPLNDSLQTWRIYQTKVNQNIQQLNRMLKRAPAGTTKPIQDEIDSIKMSFERYNRGIVQRNPNAFGDYVDKYTY